MSVGCHRTSYLRFALFLFGAGGGVALACGFPDVHFGEVEAGDVPDANPSDAPNDAGSNLDAPGDDIEASTRQDGQARIEAGALCPGNPCDCDNDGYQAPGRGCRDEDCDDRDPLVHPGQTYVAEPPAPPNEGNWDCVDPIEKQYISNLNCGLLGGTGRGFKDDPPCGTVSKFYECTGLLGGSTEIGTRRQGCK